MALREGARRWSYLELAGAVDAHAALLRALGVRAGDRVMIVGENCMAMVALIFAAAELDAWSVTVNARLAPPELDQIARHSGARRVLYTVAASPEARAHAARAGATAHGELMAGPLNAACQGEPVAASNQQVAALVYTSGTMGEPKGVMLTHRNLLYVAAVSSRLRALAPADRVYGVLPISHVYGLASMMLGTLRAGACLHLVPRFAADALLLALREDGITVLQGVPAMYARLLALAGGGAPLASTLRFAYAGGAPLDPQLKREVEQLLGVALHNGYGLTESAPTICQTDLAAPREDTAVGMPIPGVSVRLVDRDGADVAPGAAGELWVRGPNVMMGYYKAAALTAAAMRPGHWLNTGDLARQHGDGALSIIGRTKEVILRSGFNVMPLEVETVLNAHASVTQSAVVGRAAGAGNEEVVAFVELDARAPVDTQALHAYLAARLAPYKCPSEIVVMAALPAAASGKVLKGRLRALAAEMRAA
jgi:long-chain acyl-CoA synthetase